MQLVNVNCSNCGELLSIPESVKLATCNGCEMPLAIKQTDSVTFTEPMLLARPEHLAVVPFEEKEPNKLELPGETILEIVTEKEEPVIETETLIELGMPTILSEDSRALIEMTNQKHKNWKLSEEERIRVKNDNTSFIIVLVLLIVIAFVLHSLGFMV